MKRQIAWFATLAALVIAVGGCAHKQASGSLILAKPKPSNDITKSSYVAADALIGQIRQTLPPDAPLIAATLVNINRLDQSSPLGRLITEQVAGRFAQSGYHVIEVKLRSQIYMKRNEGELILTREVRDIARQHNATAIITGTYVDSADRVFVNLKMIDFESNTVLGAFDYYLDRDALVRSLLSKADSNI